MNKPTWNDDSSSEQFLCIHKGFNLDVLFPGKLKVIKETLNYFSSKTIAGGDRRDSSASGKFEEVKRFQFRPQGMSQRGGQIDPQHIQEKLKNLSNFYADESDTSADENDTSENDISEVSPEDEEVRRPMRKTSL